jgi:hypothetical protein
MPLAPLTREIRVSHCFRLEVLSLQGAIMLETYFAVSFHTKTVTSSFDDLHRGILARQTKYHHHVGCTASMLANAICYS